MTRLAPANLVLAKGTTAMAMPYDFHTAHRQPMARPAQLTALSSSDALGRVIELIRRRSRFNIGVADTRHFPFSAICRLQMEFPDEHSLYQGTGFYIAPNLILTAGHNFISDGGREAIRIVVQPGYNNGSIFPDITVTPEDWEVHPRFRAHHDSGFDMGVIHVEQGPHNGEYFRLINYSPVADTPLALSGYGLSETVSGDIQHLDIATYKGLEHNGEMLRFDIYALGGHSGSPCFVDFEPNRSGGYSSEHLPVMAILQGGRTDLNNRGVLLTPEKIEWARGRARISGAQSLSMSLSSMKPGPGGLPLVARSRASLGGLPLMPASQPAAPTRLGSNNGTAPVSVAQSHYARQMERSWIVADPDRGMSVERRTFGKSTNDLSGKTHLKVTVRNMPEGGSVHWNIPDADDRTRVMFEVGGSTAQSANGTEVTLRALAPGVARVDCMVKDASGTTIESNKYVVSSPQFAKVVFDPSVDTFLRSVNLVSRRNAIIGEMRSVIHTLYENVNVRFVLPGDTMPAHLDTGADPAYPGGRGVPQHVSVIEILGNRTPPDPGFGLIPDAPANFPPKLFGINHSLRLLPPPFDTTNLINVMLAHFRDIDEVGAVEDVINSSSQPASNLDQAATMYGRLLGETSAHEFGHLPNRTAVHHNRSATGTAVPDGLMAVGWMRTFAERTGMSPGSSGNLLSDNGLGGINRLNASNLHNFEESLPVNPPLDAAELRTRGRAGSFSWNARSLSGETVHLPGATVLEGWQAKVLIFAIEEAIASAMATVGIGTFFTNQFIVDFDRILDVCDRANITIGLGNAIGGGILIGGTAGAGIVFAPGRRIGFYGSLSAVAGAVASGGLSAQVTVVRGGPEAFGGSSYTIGASVSTIGWLDVGMFDIPVGAHVILNPQGKPIGFTAEIGVSVGIPVVSLVEVYGQAVWTETTIDAVAQGLSQPAADPQGDLRSRAMAEAIATGATPEQAAEFINQLFQ